MSTPTQGRVLDVTLALTPPDATGQRALASVERASGDQAALPASAVAAAGAQRSADELAAMAQRLGTGLGGEGDGLGYAELDLSRLPRDEVQSLLAARARYKLKVFSSGVHRVQQDPALADVRPCVNVAELDSGACIITDLLKREIQAAQAKAAQLKARDDKLRRVKSAALPAIERKLALVIGINKYADKRIPELSGAIPDARALRDMLQLRLGYEPTVVENASREAIIKAFNKLALEAEPNDSVIVYYAGHGVVVPVDGADTGFWVPADGDSDKPDTWVSNADIARMVSAVSARQVMLVSDSCYSGRLVGQDRLQTTATDADELLKRRAVVVMSSGGDEPVADQGRNGHSVFAWHFMRALDGLDAWQAGGSLFGRIRQSVVKEFPQTPQYGSSRAGGHEGNTDYLFERRELQALRP